MNFEFWLLIILLLVLLVPTQLGNELGRAAGKVHHSFIEAYQYEMKTDAEKAQARMIEFYKER